MNCETVLVILEQIKNNKHLGITSYKKVDEHMIILYGRKHTMEKIQQLIGWELCIYKPSTYCEGILSNY